MIFLTYKNQPQYEEKYFAQSCLLFNRCPLFGTTQPADACTRVLYKGTNKTVITARTMDWKDEIDANLWIFPRGMERSGNVGKSSVKWNSKYGSVITSAWDIATTDGINEKDWWQMFYGLLKVSIQSLIQRHQNKVLPFPHRRNMRWTIMLRLKKPCKI